MSRSLHDSPIKPSGILHLHYLQIETIPHLFFKDIGQIKPQQYYNYQEEIQQVSVYKEHYIPPPELSIEFSRFFKKFSVFLHKKNSREILNFPDFISIFFRVILQEILHKLLEKFPTDYPGLSWFLSRISVRILHIISMKHYRIVLEFPINCCL